MPEKTKMKVADIKVAFYVREEISQDRVDQFADLYTSGVTLPPLLVAKDSLELIDGRHRLQALQFLECEEVDVQFTEETDRVVLIGTAFKENFGGALPPTQSDIEHTIKILIQAGAPAKAIVAQLAPLPSRIVHHYLKDVRSQLVKDRLVAAMNDVLDGTHKLPEAAKKHDVSEEALKEKLSGKRSKKRKNATVGDAKSVISKQCHIFSGMFVGRARKLIQANEDGDVSDKDMVAFFEKFGKQVKQIETVKNDWLNRFETKRKQRGK